jgi:protein TonB
VQEKDSFHVYKEPLSPALRRVLLAGVIFFHVGAGYALTQVEPPRLVVGDVSPMEVSFVDAPAAQPPAPQDPDIPLPEDTPPPEREPPKLESMIQPQPPDLPPPVFPVEAPPPPPKPQPPKPQPPPPHPRPRQATPAAPPSDAPPQQAAAAPAAQQAGPKVVNDAQVGYLTRPAPIYPMRSKRAGDQGTVMVRVLVDATGRPSQVVLQKSSGHPELDESALSALRAARFRPFMDAGVAAAVWVICPIGFALQ